MPLTVVIPSYQRREPLRRLLVGLAAQVGADPDLHDVEAVVVVDGSTDGTTEMLEHLDVGPMTLRWSWQPNAGLSAARNAGLASVQHDGIVWFLDDDMVPGEGLVSAHARVHHGEEPVVVMGPCLFPASQRVVGMNRRWADKVYELHAASGVVASAAYFSAANTSAPAELWRRFGGFSEEFVGWGAEDHELGVRLLASGVTVRYLPDAVAWHEQERSLRAMCRTKEDEGANLVRLFRLHPEEADALLPWRRPNRLRRALRPLRRHPRRLRTVARAFSAVAVVEEQLTAGRMRLAFRAAVETSLLAGVASVDEDGTYVKRMVDPPPSAP